MGRALFCHELCAFGWILDCPDPRSPVSLAQARSPHRPAHCADLHDSEFAHQPGGEARLHARRSGPVASLVHHVLDHLERRPGRAGADRRRPPDHRS